MQVWDPIATPMYALVGGAYQLLPETWQSWKGRVKTQPSLL